MRRFIATAALCLLALPILGCDQGLFDTSLKAEITGKGPSEPGGKAPVAAKPAHEAPEHH